MVYIESDNPCWAPLVVPDYITHGIISATNDELITLKAMLVLTEKGISVANLRKTKQLRGLSKSYSLFLIAYDRPNTEAFITMAQLFFLRIQILKPF